MDMDMDMDMEKEKDKAAKAVDEAAKKIADAEAKTAEERALYDATMKRARDAEERVRESKEASLAMRAGLIRLSTVMGDSRDIRDFMRAMRAAEEIAEFDTWHPDVRLFQDRQHGQQEDGRHLHHR